ncbi:MAG: hypothetical protein KF830_15495 [Planctomycetes bacterium]|nr:hypothetical protein [Planctomycetota bacterium]
MLLSNKMLGNLALLTGLLPSNCAGTGRVEVSGPIIGDWKVGYTWVKENKDLVVVTATLPPGFPGGVGGTPQHQVLLPANPTEHPLEYECRVKDPIILQIPLGWQIDSATITTPLGTGDVIVGPGAVPSMLTIGADGSLAPTNFYTPEPGYQIFFLDCPPALEALGTIQGTLTLLVPPSERRIDKIKVIETWKVTFLDANGDAVEYFAPIDPLEHDFANVDDIAHTFVVDATTLACVGPTGASPRAELAGIDWNLGNTVPVNASHLDPEAMSFLLLGWDELAAPVLVGAPGCSLRIAIADVFYVPTADDGTASLPVAVPNDATLVGWSLLFQPVQLDLSTSATVTGWPLKARIEP